MFTPLQIAIYIPSLTLFIPAIMSLALYIYKKIVHGINQILIHILLYIYMLIFIYGNSVTILDTICDNIEY